MRSAPDAPYPELHRNGGSPEGPWSSKLWTAATHVLVAGLFTAVGCSVDFAIRRLPVLLSGYVPWTAAATLSGFAAGLYVGRELGEPDPVTNAGSLLDVLGALLGVLGTLWLYRHLLL